MSRIPATGDVTQQVRALIKEGYEPGDRLPSETEMARRLGVSRNTVREVLGQLWLEGVVLRRWGVGTFVSEPRQATVGMMNIGSVRDMLRSNGFEPELSFYEICQVDADVETSRLLGLSSGELAWQVDRVFSVEGRAVAWLQDYLPPAINGRELDPTPLSNINVDLLSLLRDTAKTRVERMEAELSATVADEVVASRMGLTTGHPLITTDQTSYAETGDIIVVSRILYNTDAAALRLVRTPSHAG